MMMIALLFAAVTPAQADHVAASGDTRRIERSVAPTKKRPVLDHKGRIVKEGKRFESVDALMASL